ncbi:hypothetical protein JCM10908_001966 [Rhodotorula pacifica]|uniref:uncharacterized protein n=1 Tax=Rhodotorula pacifica TaxID=1495444 RepID=UPI003178EBF4
MADDELDPAFLDLDLPTHASSSLSSLGAGFGSSLDIDNDEDSFEAQLGAGFGSTLENEVEELRLGNGALTPLEELDADEPRSVHHFTSSSSSSRLAEAYGNGRHIGSDDEAGRNAFRTPSRQKRARVRTERQQQSLASELASVARPQRERALLRELGLEDVDDDEGSTHSDGETDRNSESSCEGDGSPRRMNGNRNHLENDLLASARRPRVNGAARHSQATQERAAAFALREEEEAAERERQIEQDLELAAADLTDSSGDILSFMSRLRIQLSSSDYLETAAPLPRISSGSSPLDYRDRQSVIEDLCSTFLRSLHSSATKRAEQLHDLTLLERDVARTDAGWQGVLAGLDPLPQDLFEDRASAAIGLDDAGLPSSELSNHGDGPASPSHPTVTSSTLNPAAAIPADLASLRTTTQSLLSLLASLAEQTQVQSALTSESGRKLRALRTQLGTLKDEVGGVERSEAFVRGYEEKMLRMQTGDKGGSAAERARTEVEEVRRRLDSGWSRAQEILTSCA